MPQQQQALEVEKRRRRRRVHIGRCTFVFQKIVSGVKVDFISLSQEVLLTMWEISNANVIF